MIFIETDRLLLRNVAAKDADIMYDYRNNEICARYQRGQTKDYKGIVALTQRRQNDVISVAAPFMVAVALKETDELIGEIVVMPNDGAISIGYTFHYNYHRKGYAYEALSALTELLHTKYPEWDFICFTDYQNKPSMALLKKLGYRDMGYYASVDSQVFSKWTEVFRKPEHKDCQQIEAFKEEFISTGSSMDGTGYLRRYDAPQWLESNKMMETVVDDTLVPSLQYGLFRKEDGRLLGLLQIRLELKGYLEKFGGHIGYCVRPSERQKGYAKQMLKEALQICRECGLDKVLITCLADNTASERTIRACGGVYESTVMDDINYQRQLKRFWISTKEK